MPAKGIKTIVRSSCNCSRLASHSRCASDPVSESSALLDIDGNESTSSSLYEDAERSGMMNDSEVDIAGEGVRQ